MAAWEICSLSEFGAQNRNLWILLNGQRCKHSVRDEFLISCLCVLTLILKRNIRLEIVYLMVLIGTGAYDFYEGGME